MKKRLFTITVSVVCILALGVSIFLLVRSRTSSDLCESFILKTRQVSINVGDKLALTDDLYTMSPVDCSATPTITSDDSELIMTDEYLTSNKVGSYTLKFSVPSIYDKPITDSLSINVLAKADYTVNFTIASLDIFLGETTSINCLKLNADTNSPFNTTPVVSYATDNICTLDLSRMTITPIAIGRTKIRVALISDLGFVVYDEIIINVLPMPERRFSLPDATYSQTHTVNTPIIIEYYLMQNDSLMHSQSVTLSLLKNGNDASDYLNVIDSNTPYIIFTITTAGDYSLVITSVADNSVSVNIAIHIE